MPYKDPEKQKAAKRRYYEENIEKYRNATRDRRNKNRRYIEQIKTNAVCADCKIDYPHYVLQFDHLKDKVAGIAELAKHGTLAALKIEIAKCEIVCANCHSHRTWMRSKGRKLNNNPMPD